MNPSLARADTKISNDDVNFLIFSCKKNWQYLHEALDDTLASAFAKAESINLENSRSSYKLLINSLLGRNLSFQLTAWVVEQKTSQLLEI